MDFAGNEVSIQDFYSGYNPGFLLRLYIGMDALDITIANQKESFRLEGQTSSKYIIFIERGLPNAV